jgi:hypothetical protein
MGFKGGKVSTEEFAALMNGIESAVTTLAIVIAGGWALFTFWTLGQQARARSELQKLELERRKIELDILGADQQKRRVDGEIQKLEQEARIGPVIEITISAKQRSLPDDDSYYVDVIVAIANNGIRNTRLAYDKSRNPFLVFAAKVNENGTLDFIKKSAHPVHVGRHPQSTSPSVIVRAGGVERIPFFFRVDSKGLYFLVFWARASEEEQASAKELGFMYPGNYVGKMFFIVE